MNINKCSVCNDVWHNKRRCHTQNQFYTITADLEFSRCIEFCSSQKHSSQAKYNLLIKIIKKHYAFIKYNHTWKKFYYVIRKKVNEFLYDIKNDPHLYNSLKEPDKYIEKLTSMKKQFDKPHISDYDIYYGSLAVNNILNTVYKVEIPHIQKLIISYLYK